MKNWYMLWLALLVNISIEVALQHETLGRIMGAVSVCVSATLMVEGQDR